MTAARTKNARTKNLETAVALVSAMIATFIGLLAGALSGGFDSETSTTASTTRPAIGLSTSLPIFWNDGPGFGSLASGDAEFHWVRTYLEERYELALLDTLAAAEDVAPSDRMAGLDRIILAQPRAYAPAEFAALDMWLRDGGRALIFADPYLTEHSDYMLGDPRSPQGVALLSPVLSRWGLSQTFDEDQPAGLRSIRVDGTLIPVDRFGVFTRMPDGLADCVIEMSGVLADCKIGRGRVVILGDAALLDGEQHSELQRDALAYLMRRVFGGN